MEVTPDNSRIGRTMMETRAGFKWIVPVSGRWVLPGVSGPHPSRKVRRRTAGGGSLIPFRTNRYLCPVTSSDARGKITPVKQMTGYPRKRKLLIRNKDSRDSSEDICDRFLIHPAFHEQVNEMMRKCQ
jgi:hypothetical protein